MIERVDVLVVGGGLIGKILTYALSLLNCKVRMVDAVPLSLKKEAFDARSLALSSSSVRILKGLGLWSFVSAYATEIQMIHVSEQGTFGKVRLTREKPEDLLGFVIEMEDLQAALDQVFDAHQYAQHARVLAVDPLEGVVQLEGPSGISTLQASLVIAADGTDSFLRQCCDLPAQRKNYDQEALVTTLGLRRSHQGVAYERFTGDGPMALLPLSGLRVGLVWVGSPEKTKDRLILSDVDFLQKVQDIMGYRLGKLERVGQKKTYPLSLVTMPIKHKGRVLFIGNAAHTLHPIAGQGFNLGLRDIAILVECIQSEGLSTPMYDIYLKARAHDEKMITHLTDQLMGLFGASSIWAKWGRQAGLLLLEHSVLCQRLLAHYAGGYGGKCSRLASEIPNPINAPAIKSLKK